MSIIVWPATNTLFVISLNVISNKVSDNHRDFCCCCVYTLRQQQRLIGRLNVSTYRAYPIFTCWIHPMNVIITISIFLAKILCLSISDWKWVIFSITKFQLMWLQSLYVNWEFSYCQSYFRLTLQHTDTGRSMDDEHYKWKCHKDVFLLRFMNFWVIFYHFDGTIPTRTIL